MTPQELTPNEVARAEQLVSRISGVSSCRITTGAGGEIAEVHVISAGRKPAKLVARDVESLLKAELGIDVDHRKIGVVTVDEEEAAVSPANSPATSPAPIPATASATAPAPARAPADDVEEFPIEEVPVRFAFHSVNLFSDRGGVRAEVELSRDNLQAFGTGHSENTTAQPWSVIASATLQAISEFLDDDTRLCLGGVLKVALADRDAFVVRVDLIEQTGARTLAGCSVVTGNEHQSVVFATLDAVNRVIGKLEFRSTIEYRIK